MNATTLPWTEALSDTELVMTLDATVYSHGAIEQACYWMTDRCYVHLERGEGVERVRVRIALKSGDGDLRAVAGEFGNRLLDEVLRRQIADETRPIRELIVGQAFAEADFEPGNVPPRTAGHASK